ncbi:MFS transporter [Rhizobium puerariae]|uniref:MFS transporter n=1 Tax=Rhizobium puerariae TaxID=1585791 RepID=A0ABV6AQQ4_9HYPH
MTSSKSVENLLDGVKPNPFMIRVWVLCGLILLFDGYDLTVISFIAPELVKEFGFDKSLLGALFASSLVGFALAGPLLGLIGDRYGRKSTIILSCLLFGVATLAMMLTTTISGMIVCRFIVGLGLGGALPTTTAMIAEFAPKGMRVRVLALVSTAVPLGAMVPGLLTAALVPSYGWQILVIVGGVLPVFLAICLIWAMPESIKYLALRPKSHARLAALLKRLASALPALEVGGVAKQSTRDNSPARLFSHGLAGITLLMWASFFLNAMALYLVINWLPLVLQSQGMSVSQAGQYSALFAGGGLVGGFMIAALISWMGVLLLPILFIVAVPFLVAFASFDLPHIGIILCVFIPGLSVGALQVACVTISGLLYPTAIRASGIGWGLGVGRIGAIVGPFVGAAILALQLPERQMISFSAIPMAVGGIGAFILVILCYRRFGSLQVDELSPETPLASVSSPTEQASNFSH